MTQEQSDKYYLNVAKLCANNSYARRLQVGAVIVKDNQIMSDGFNGTPSGFENNCETETINSGEHCHPYECFNCKDFSNGEHCLKCEQRKVKLTTKPEVLHAESNAILKCAKYGRPTNGSTLYITHSPCIECAKLIIQAGIKRVVYLEDYHKNEGINLLKKANIDVEKYI